MIGSLVSTFFSHTSTPFLTIPGYLFRATSGGIMQVAGLSAVSVPGIENFNVTELVPGHMAYRAAMPKLLREVGWIVESDEFTEIEDPDPDNHEQRQRELINEIEEARKELEQKPEKKGGFSFWRKKKAAKKDWEVYDEHSQQRGAEKDRAERSSQDTAAMAENPVIFDLDAIRKEVAALSADGVEVKEIKSTLPPMKIDMPATTTPTSPYANLRETKSFNDSIGHTGANASTLSNGNLTSGKKIYDEYDYDEFADGGAAGDGDISMTFDTSFTDSAYKTSKADPPLYSQSYSQSVSLSQTPDPAINGWDTHTSQDRDRERPALKAASTEPVPVLAPSYNAWADEFDDEFGKEKELKMTFE